MFEGETETELNDAMKERAKGVGLTMMRPQWSPNTMRVHEATAYAKEKGLDDKFHHLAAGAYWETGADLNDMGVLQGIAEQSGLDWGELSPIIESKRYKDQVLEDYEAAKALGIGGTPSYMIGGELLKGDISLEDLNAAVENAAKG